MELCVRAIHTTALCLEIYDVAHIVLSTLKWYKRNCEKKVFTSHANLLSLSNLKLFSLVFIYASNEFSNQKKNIIMMIFVFDKLLQNILLNIHLSQ